MRILFYVAKGREGFAHALARGLSQRLGSSRFAAVAFQDRAGGEYLRSQTGGLMRTVLTDSQILKEVAESGYPVDPDEIERIERIFGIPTIWQYVVADRRLCMERRGFLYREGTVRPVHELLAVIQARFTQVALLMERFQPDVVLYAGVDTGQGLALVVERHATTRGIPVLVPHVARIGSYLTLNSTLYSRFPHVENRLAELRHGATSDNQELARRLIAEFRRGGQRYTTKYARQESSPGYWSIVSKKLRRGVHAVRTELLGGHHWSGAHDPHATPLIRRMLDSAVTTLRSWHVQTRVEFSRPNPGESYVFFPLHEEPELALLLNAPFHRDQAAVVQNVAHSLPGDTRLYVKDHPAMTQRGRRPRAYYERLRRIPNVRLVTGDSHELISGAMGVVTITGTAGFEAMLLGKPVLTLGTVFYNAAEQLVQHTSDTKNLPYCLNRFKKFRSDEGFLVNFLSALLDESVDISIRELLLQLKEEGIDSTMRGPVFQRYLSFLVPRIVESSLRRSELSAEVDASRT